MARPAGSIFTVMCCGSRRGILPGGVLVCASCDFNHEHATVMPNERHAKDVPEGVKHWAPEIPDGA